MATDVKPNAFARFGNDLHSGARSYPFVGKRRLWLAAWPAAADGGLGSDSGGWRRLQPGY